MPEKIQLPIDMQELCAAFEDSSDDHRYYLDLETGGITLDFLDAAEREELDEMVDEDSKERYRYLQIAESQVQRCAELLSERERKMVQVQG